jgi:hypothetical protein
MWTAAIVLVFATIGVARCRLDDEKGGELERESEIEAAIEQAFSAIAEAPPEGVRSASLGGDQTTDQESRSRLTEALLLECHGHRHHDPRREHDHRGDQDSAPPGVRPREGQGRIHRPDRHLPCSLPH